MTLPRALVVATAAAGAGAQASLVVGQAWHPVAGAAGLVAVVGGIGSGAVLHEAGRGRTAELASRLLLGAGVLLAGLALLTSADIALPLATGVTVLSAAQGLRQRVARDAAVSVLVAVAGLVLATGLGTSRLLVLPVLATWAAVVLALVLLVEAAGRDGDGPGEPVGPALRRAAPVVATAVVAGLLVFLLLPRPSGPDDGGGGLGGGGTAAGGGPAADRSAQAYSSGVLDMSSRGELPDTPLLEVPAGSPDLWRGGALDAYDGRTWSTTSSEGLPEALAADPPPGLVRTRAETHRVLPLQPYPVVVAPGPALEVRADRGGAVLLPTLTYLEDPTSPYVVTSRPVPALAMLPEGTGGPVVAVGAAGAAGGDPADPRWTALPATSSRVLRLAERLVSGAPSRWHAVRAVEDHLRSTATYRLDSPVPGPGEDAVEAFLFEDRQGFCEHFAAAEVVLLRAAGVPARLATGFTTAGSEERGGRRAVLASSAHAWVEVWLPGTGWVSSDPTAGARGWGGGTLAAWLADPVESLLDAVERALASPEGRVRLAVLLLGLTGAVGVVVLVRRRRTRRADAGAGAVAVRDRRDPRRRAVLDGFDRLEAALAAAGRPRPPAAGPTAAVPAVAEVLADGLRPFDGAGLTAALAVVERACWSPVPPSHADAERAVTLLDDAAGAVHASMQATGRRRAHEAAG